ncbi:hypothetical protein Ddc_24394 [Ditylenchus destructor]|nr:hypothetical protein Ddc_24394 [Ditylenchus destructor]
MNSISLIAFLAIAVPVSSRLSFGRPGHVVVGPGKGEVVVRPGQGEVIIPPPGGCPIAPPCSSPHCPQPPAGAYCAKCICVVSGHCRRMPSSHPNCYDFNDLSAQDLCTQIGAYHLCYVIEENLYAARALVTGHKGTPEAICSALEFC